MVLASEGLVVPHPWEVRKSATYLGKDTVEVSEGCNMLRSALQSAHDRGTPKV